MTSFFLSPPKAKNTGIGNQHNSTPYKLGFHLQTQKEVPMKLSAVVIAVSLVSIQAFAQTKSTTTVAAPPVAPAPVQSHAPAPVATTPTITPNPSGRINNSLPAQPPIERRYVAPDNRPPVVKQQFPHGDPIHTNVP